MIKVTQLGANTDYYFSTNTAIDALLKMSYTLNLKERTDTTINMAGNGRFLYIEDNHGEIYYCEI